jgi:hypothetical protein
VGRLGRGDQALTRAPGDAREATGPTSIRPWNVILPIAFAGFSGYILLVSVLEPLSIGSHATIYTAAAAAWLDGENPWVVGPPAAVFAGPPPMLLLFAPFTVVSEEFTRVAWVGAAAASAVLVIRRLRLPGYWLGFPPIFQSIMLGHPEVILLWLLVAGGAAGGVAAAVKPYAALPLLAQRRWRALIAAAVVVVVTVPVLPWVQFLEQLPHVAATLATQANGDSVFGNPVLMIVAVAILATYGVRRALWLATPLLWPSAQFLYRTMSVPRLSPIIAVLWALPIPGATLVGLVADSLIRLVGRRSAIPGWLAAGVRPVATDPTT